MHDAIITKFLIKKMGENFEDTFPIAPGPGAHAGKTNAEVLAESMIIAAIREKDASLMRLIKESVEGKSYDPPDNQEQKTIRLDSLTEDERKTLLSIAEKAEAGK